MNQQEFFDVLTGKVIMQFRVHLLASIKLPLSSATQLDECKWQGYIPGKATIKSSVQIGESGIVIVDGSANFINTESLGIQMIAGHAIGIVDDDGKELIAGASQLKYPQIAPKGQFEVLFSIYAQSYIGIP